MEVGDADVSVDEGGNGKSDRATVALVYHAIGEVKELTKAGFVDVQRQLDALGSDVTDFAREITMLKGLSDSNKERIFALETRVTDVEQQRELEHAAQKDRRSYRTTDLPQIMIGVGLFSIAAVQAFHIHF